MKTVNHVDPKNWPAKVIVRPIIAPMTTEKWEVSFFIYDPATEEHLATRSVGEFSCAEEAGRALDRLYREKDKLEAQAEQEQKLTELPTPRAWKVNSGGGSA